MARMTPEPLPTGRVRGRRFVRALVRRGAVAAALAALVVTTTSPLETPRNAATGPDDAVVEDAITHVSGGRCADLLLITVDGNGQGGKATPGRVTGRVVSDLQRRGAAEGRTVAVRPIRISTRGARVLAQQHNRPAQRAVTTQGIRTWRAPIANAVKRTRNVVANQVGRCPEQQLAFVGYAQGAAVVHRVLQLAGPKQRQLFQGAVTIGDPWRVQRSVVGQPLGAPAAGPGTQGLLSRFANRVGDVPATTDTFRVVSVCSKGDVVCNPNPRKFSNALTRHHYAATKASREALDSASWALWQRITLSPVPVDTRIDTPIAGERFSVKLAVNGGSPSGDAAVWSAPSLPAGLQLSAGGELSGTLPAGTHTITYTVRGRAPATVARSGSVTIVVHAASGTASAGGQTSCEVRPNGSAWCWGDNEFGQVGDGSTVDRPSPRRVPGDWSRISTSGGTTCGVRADGTLWCWGLNNFGQLGSNDSATVRRPRQVGGAANWDDVSVSWHHACGVRVNGRAWCWGHNANGQAGTGATARRTNGPRPVAGAARFTRVTTGGWHSCGINRKGFLLCWGRNDFGQIGDGTKQRRITPRRVSGGEKYVDVDADFSRTCAVTTQGRAQCWGDNLNGELGTGNRNNSTTPAAVQGARTWSRVTTGVSHTCGAETSGRIWCWGDNRYGQLGSGGGNAARSTSPVRAGRTTTGGALSAGWLHTCASGTTCWGAGDKGELGTGQFASISMPPRTQPTWPRGSSLTTAQVNNRAAARIARDVVANRPNVPPRARNGAATFGVMTFNVLGTQHTAPGGGRPDWAPGRVRTEWARSVVENRNVSLVGLSEPQPKQITWLDQTLRGRWTIYPGNTMGYAPSPQSVMWRDADWEFVWGNTASMPFMRGQRPQPVVRLRHRETQREVYLINAHLSPGNMQADRDKGIAIIVALVKTLEADGLPILVTGDLNEKAAAFRRIACGAQMEAAVGGTSNGATCTLPPHMRVDWIFGKGGSFSNTNVATIPRIRRTTDHAVISSRFTVR